MSKSQICQEIDALMADQSLTLDQKKQQLEKMGEDARALQRAATESSMEPEDGLQDDLRIIELTLEKLGVDLPEEGAATL